MVNSIVLAEDNLEHCFFFERALREVAPRTSFSAVHDGDNLVRLLESYLPDLLFLDLGMPCKNGVQCIREIREQRAYDSMPIVVFSINDDQQAIQSAYGYGANLYIVKPDEYFLLKSVLQKVLAMDWNHPKAITEQYFTSSKYVPFTVA
ncbi:MAG: response regulator [Flavisolibacter sp.]